MSLFDQAAINFLRSCDGKMQYATRELARAACNQMRDRGRAHQSKSRLNFYKCEYGDHWHVGHERTRRTAQVKAARRARA